MTVARIGIFEIESRSVDTVVSYFREQALPRFEALAGFKGYQAFTDEQSGRYVGISYWESREALEASEAVASVIRDEVEPLGARIQGAPMIVTEAFDDRRA